MKLKAGQVHDAMVALIAIIRRPRKLPQTAKYRIARMHSALEKEFQLLEEERAKLVKELGHEVFADAENTQSQGWQIEQNTDNFKLYTDRWNEMRNQELEVNVQPITLASLGNDESGIESDEFKLLGELITE